MVALEDFLESSMKGQSNSPPDDTTDKEVISELLHGFSGLWSQPGVFRKEHLECAVVVCLEVGRDVKAEVSKPEQPWYVLTEVEECRTPENATVRTQ